MPDSSRDTGPEDAGSGDAGHTGPETPGSDEPSPKAADADSGDTALPDGAVNDGRRDNRRSMQIGTAILLGVLAFAVIAQSRDSGTEDFENVRSEELVELLRSLDISNKRLDDQIADLTATRDDLRDANTRTEAATAQARQRVDALAILAGTVPAKGPGVAILVEEKNGQRINASAVLDAIEELRNAGAEVIVVNGTARIVGSSYVVDSDSGIRIDGRSLQAPYQIEVIGDSRQLATTAKMPGGLIETLSRAGATVSVEKKDLIAIDALADSKDPEYARPE